MNAIASPPSTTSSPPGTTSSSLGATSSSLGLTRGSSMICAAGSVSYSSRLHHIVSLDLRVKPEDDEVRDYCFLKVIGNFALIVLSLIFFTTPAQAAELKVLGKYFYGEVLIDGQSGHRKKTTRIPNVPDKMCFGWVINVEPGEELAKITEIFTLPGPPKNWGGVEDDPYSQTTTSTDRKTATTTRFMPLKSGILENNWCITQGDQSGNHHIVVLYGSQVLAEFEFEVYD